LLGYPPGWRSNITSSGTAKALDIRLQADLFAQADQDVSVQQEFGFALAVGFKASGNRR
jgi:hypothetical protein